MAARRDDVRRFGIPAFLIALATFHFSASDLLVQPAWRTMVAPSSDTSDYAGMFFLNRDTGWVIHARTIYRTTDGGEAWHPVEPSTVARFRGVHFLDIDSGFAWNSTGIWFTGEGGASWERRDNGILFNPPTGTDRIFTINDLFFRDTRTGWAVGNYQGIWRTDDGGRSWESSRVRWTDPFGQEMDLYAFNDIEFLNANVGWAVGGERRLFPTRTTDGGRTWRGDTAYPEFLRGGTMHRVSFVDSLHGVAAGEPDVVYISNDGGGTWENREVILGDTSFFVLDAVRPMIDRVIVAGIGHIGDLTSSRATIAVSEDRGTAWRVEFEGEPGDAFDHLVFPDSTRGFALSRKGRIYRYDSPDITGTPVPTPGWTIVAPVPAFDKLFVQFTAPGSSSATIEIISSLGTIVERREWHASSQGEYRELFDLSDLNDGIYFVRVRTGSSSIIHLIPHVSR